MATAAEQQAFIRDYGDYARQVSNNTGIGRSFILGQWALETGWGTQFAGQNNLGNIQGSAAQPYNYPSIAAGVNAYQSTMMNSRYSAARDAASPESFAQAVAKAGYAADPDYATKLKNVIGSVDKMIGVTPESNNSFISDPLEWVKNKGINAGFIVLGAGLLVYMLIQASGKDGE